MKSAIVLIVAFASSTNAVLDPSQQQILIVTALHPPHIPHTPRTTHTPHIAHRTARVSRVLWWFYVRWIYFRTLLCAKQTLRSAVPLASSLVALLVFSAIRTAIFRFLRLRRSRLHSHCRPWTRSLRWLKCMHAHTHTHTYTHIHTHARDCVLVFLCFHFFCALTVCSFSFLDSNGLTGSIAAFNLPNLIDLCARHIRTFAFCFAACFVCWCDCRCADVAAISGTITWLDPSHRLPACRIFKICNPTMIRCLRSCGNVCYVSVLVLSMKFRDFVRVFLRFPFFCWRSFPHHSRNLSFNSLTGTIPQLVGLTNLAQMFVFAVFCTSWLFHAQFRRNWLEK